MAADERQRSLSLELKTADELQQPTALTVSQLVRRVNSRLEAQFSAVWVEGEVSNLRRPSSGHIYLTLKDRNAQLPVVIFRSTATRLRFRLEDGQQLRCRGRLTVYEAQGRFQLTADAVEPVGLGELQVAFEQLKARLSEEGLFADERKQPLPRCPRSIAVVTSPTGAALRDVLRVLQTRLPVRLVLCPTAVSGADASQEIVAALHRADQLKLDLIILTRGGGSLEDLWAFNKEDVARAVLQLRTPIIAAIGHEVDVTIAELVADRRAATPSAAAEIAVPKEADSRRQLSLLRERLGRQVERRLRDARRTIEATRAKLAAPQRLIDRRRLLIDELSQRSERSLNQRLRAAREVLASAMLRLERQRPQTQLLRSAERISGLHQRLVATMHGRLGENRSHLGYLAGRLNALSPLAVLERGYSVTRNLRGEVLVEANAANLGEMLLIDLFRGRLQVRVEQQLDAESSPRPAGLDEGKSH